MLFEFILLQARSASTDLILAIAMCLVPFVLGWLAAQAYYKVGALRTRTAQLEQELGTLNGKVETLNTDLTDARVRLTQADADIHDKNTTLSRLRNQLTIAEADLNVLKYKLEEMEKMPVEGESATSDMVADNVDVDAAALTPPAGDGINDPFTAPVFEQPLASEEASATGERMAAAPSGEAAAMATAAAIPFANGRYRHDDLEIVEGIGPKIAELLRDAGINTWRQLAEADPSRIQQVLDAAGPRYNIHNPETWAEQARLADAGDWDALQQLQSRLRAGRG
jgi:predicted flap endonuclease-1-like 5' DNA nuclease